MPILKNYIFSNTICKILENSLTGHILAKTVPGSLKREDWHYKTFSLQCYFTPFHSLKDLEIINEVSFIQF